MPIILNGVIKIVKTKVYDGICVINVKTKIESFECLKKIKEELKKRQIELCFSGVCEERGNLSSIILAVFENDLFGAVSAFGCIRYDAGIVFYTLRCLCSIVFWEGEYDTESIFKRYNDKVCYICEWRKYGILICENEIKHKILAQMK